MRGLSRFRELVVRKGFVTEEQLREADRKQEEADASPKPLGEVLLELGYLSDAQLLEVLEELLREN